VTRVAGEPASPAEVPDDVPDGVVDEARRRDFRIEILLVLGVSLGYSAVYATINLLGKLTEHKRLADTQATLNGAFTIRPLLDLFYQLASISFGIVPALLALHLLRRAGTPRTAIGWDGREPRRDAVWAAALAAVIGIPGLGLYLAAHALGLSATVVPVALADTWWRIPVLVLSAAMNGILEEIVVVAYLLTRFEQLGWGRNRSLLVSAVLRGSYHLYQGFGAFVGNAVMGLIFGRVYQHRRRVLPLVLAHTTIDTVTFVGYTLLHGHVSWLP
jgi:uncharacterized protein